MTAHVLVIVGVLVVLSLYSDENIARGGCLVVLMTLGLPWSILPYLLEPGNGRDLAEAAAFTAAALVNVAIHLGLGLLVTRTRR